MSMNAPPAKQEDGPTGRSATSRVLRFVVRLPFMIVLGLARAILFSAWYLAFYVLCMFRPFTGMLLLAAIVMVPMAIAVFAHPDAANGMPFWAFILMAIGCTAFAIGYSIFLDWITPPGAEDPFARYRRGR
jgi:hypothetical protein